MVSFHKRETDKSMPIDCYFCGNQLKWRKRSDSTFCDDECRMKFNNLRRKVDAQHSKIVKSLESIQELSTEYPHLKGLDFVNIHRVKLLVNAIDFGSRYKCTKCGQMTYLEPVEWTTCDFCGACEKHGFEVVLSDHK